MKKTEKEVYVPKSTTHLLTPMLESQPLTDAPELTSIHCVGDERLLSSHVTHTQLL
jgi:hypothetical protein